MPDTAQPRHVSTRRPVFAPTTLVDDLRAEFARGVSFARLNLGMPPKRFHDLLNVELNRIHRGTDGNHGYLHGLRAAFCVAVDSDARELHASESDRDARYQGILCGVRAQQSLTQSVLQLPRQQREELVKAIDDRSWHRACVGALAMARLAHFMQVNDFGLLYPALHEDADGIDLIVNHARLPPCLVSVRSANEDDTWFLTPASPDPEDKRSANLRKTSEAVERYNRRHRTTFLPTTFGINMSQEPIWVIRDCVDVYSAVRQLRRELMQLRT